MSKNMLENIRAVIFDLDGTLVDSMWMWESIDIEFLTARGLEMPENLKYEIEGISFAQTADYFIKRFNLKDTPQELMKIWNGMAYEKYKILIYRIVVLKLLLICLLISEAFKPGVVTSRLRIACSFSFIVSFTMSFTMPFTVS